MAVRSAEDDPEALRQSLLLMAADYLSDEIDARREGDYDEAEYCRRQYKQALTGSRALRQREGVR